MIFDTSVIDHSWTLFLDRDGVINKRLPGDYVKRWEEFEFLPGVLDAMPFFAHRFGKIIVVTNQQGIAKGIYSADELNEIHKKMLAQINARGGRIDLVLFSPHLAADNHPSRKPGIGMALDAKHAFPKIDFARSLMAGDSISDLEFGRAAGMRTAHIATEHKLMPGQSSLADIEVRSLFELAQKLAD